jgi:hypothetical protein
MKVDKYASFGVTLGSADVSDRRGCTRARAVVGSVAVRFSDYFARTLVRPAVLALAGVAGLAATSTASAHTSVRRHVGRCDTHLSKLQRVKMTGQVLVWESNTGTESESGEPLITVYACLRPAGRSVAIGQRAEGGGEYVGNVQTTNLSISGVLVSDLVTTGLASQQACGKYEPGSPSCAAEVSEVVRACNVRTGRSIRQPLPAAATTYAFTPRGAIAWEAPTSPGTTGSPTAVRAVSFNPSSMQKGSVDTLDSGALGSSLHFSGLTLTWTNAGEPKSQTILRGQ